MQTAAADALLANMTQAASALRTMASALHRAEAGSNEFKLTGREDLDIFSNVKDFLAAYDSQLFSWIISIPGGSKKILHRKATLNVAFRHDSGVVASGQLAS